MDMVLNLDAGVFFLIYRWFRSRSGIEILLNLLNIVRPFTDFLQEETQEVARKQYSTNQGKVTCIMKRRIFHNR